MTAKKITYKFTPVPNALLERIYTMRLSGRDFRALQAIWRATWGWEDERTESGRRETAHLSGQVLANMTGLARSHVLAIVRKLVNVGLVHRVSPHSDEIGPVKCDRKRSHPETVNGYGAVTENGTQYKETGERNQKKETGDKINSKYKHKRQGPQPIGELIAGFPERLLSAGVPVSTSPNGKYPTASEIYDVLLQAFYQMGAKHKLEFCWPRQQTTEKHCQDLEDWHVSQEEITAALNSLAIKYGKERDRLRVIQASAQKRFSPGAELKDKIEFLRGVR